MLIVLILLGLFVGFAFYYRNKFLKEKTKQDICLKKWEKLIHKIRTPIGTIQTGILGLKHYLPILVKAYHQSCIIAPDKVVEIPASHQILLMEVLTNIEKAMQNLNKDLKEFN